ncbi:hypothetical protein CYR55_05625 [Chimaeribacter californicus]|uniref:Uncharacterized protein n=1 Tax=Chimaeribacter californicus TaxID=2060067 RepID=A0A2N5EE07_9GAMM|nr:hypothetical protein CYR55_05625 [Chimaeribacter californicus]
MTDKQPAPVGDCHIVGKAVVPGFSKLEAAAKAFEEALSSAGTSMSGSQLQALSEAMTAYHESSMPNVILSLLRQNAELKAERDALAAQLARYSMSAGQADQRMCESQAVRKALGFGEDAEDVAPIDLMEKIDALKAERDALAAENAAVKNAMSVTLEHVRVMDTGQAGVAAMIINDAMNNSKTPATDAASLRKGGE